MREKILAILKEAAAEQVNLSSEQAREMLADKIIDTNSKVMPTYQESLFLSMICLFHGNEFSHWLENQSMPLAAAKEYEEALAYFESVTGFNIAEIKIRQERFRKKFNIN
jgi:hypothetical protein